MIEIRWEDLKECPWFKLDDDDDKIQWVGTAIKYDYCIIMVDRNDSFSYSYDHEFVIQLAIKENKTNKTMLLDIELDGSSDAQKLAHIIENGFTFVENERKTND